MVNSNSKNTLQSKVEKVQRDYEALKCSIEELQNDSEWVEVAECVYGAVKSFCEHMQTWCKNAALPEYSVIDGCSLLASVYKSIGIADSIDRNRWAQIANLARSPEKKRA